MKNGKVNFGGHPALDPDEVAAMYLRLKKEGKRPEDAELSLILSEGNEEVVVNFKNVEIMDRGGTDLDHHVLGRSENGETTTSLMAKKLGIAGEKYYQQLITQIRISDLQGITHPFTICDFIKCAQRSRTLVDKERLVIGYRIIDDVMEFRKRNLQRNNQWIQEVLVNFLTNQSERRAEGKFERYLENLMDERFTRPFDLVEILMAEKAINGEEGAIRFAKTILQLIYNESVKQYRARRAIKETPYRDWVRNIFVVANDPESKTLKIGEYIEKFGTQARVMARFYRGAAIAIQQDEEGRIQIFFDTNARDADDRFIITDLIIETVVSVVRLEERLLQKRRPTGIDLRREGTMEGVPEWHFFVAPKISKKRPGKALLNGSLTAPDVPRSKIPLPVLYYIVCCAVRYQPFNWNRWHLERVMYCLKKKTT